jgi:choline/ethanolamine kinase
VPIINGSIATKRTRKDSYHNVLEPTPCSVLLRIYGQTHGEHALETMLTESVVFTLLSERQLGPKLHGIFPGGRIEQYIPVYNINNVIFQKFTTDILTFQARSLTTAELANNQISLKIAEKMSEIHSLDIPVSKEPDWLFLTLNRWLNNVETIMNDVRNNNNNDDECDAKDFPKKLSKIDFRKELQWIRRVIEMEACPVVFCHNDLQEGNILFRQSNFAPMDPCDGELNPLSDLSPLLISSPTSDSAQLTSPTNGNSRKRSLVDNSLDSDLIDSSTSGDDGFSDTMSNEKPELMIIDFEYCAYNYRAFDIANHFLGEF